VSVLLAAALFASVGVSIPASASTVTVKLSLSVGVKAPTGRLCPVQVPAGSNGIAVLDAAKAKHCIVSYKTSYFSGFGHFVRCIDGICEIDKPVFLAYWAMYENGQFTSYGVDGFVADPGDVLSFVYTY
jgi:hypothetical protein